MSFNNTGQMVTTEEKTYKSQEKRTRTWRFDSRDASQCPRHQVVHVIRLSVCSNNIRASNQTMIHNR
jgi:hypothetical protein